MSQNWLRHFELQLLDDKGQGSSLSDFKVTFSIDWYKGSSPRVAEVKIFNLKPSTAYKIMGEEFSKIRLIAGYEGPQAIYSEDRVGVEVRVNPDEDRGQKYDRNYGLIFSGDIRIAITGRETTPDTWVLIQAVDGHEAISYATVSATLSKGHSTQDFYNILLKSLEPYGIIQGIEPVFPPTRFPRGRPLHGKVATYLDEVKKLCNADWQIIDGRLDFLSKTPEAQTAIKLNSQSGLLGMPQRTTNAGVNAKCLINPNIRVNGLVHLDQSSLYLQKLSEAQISAAGDSPGHIQSIDKENNGNRTLNISTPPASVDPDGIYEVCGITTKGDTRGGDWYMELMCQARGSSDYNEKSRGAKQSKS
jgi:hypothetical protein